MSRSAIENYGQEFYDKEKQVISHAGDIGAEGSSWFSVHIPSNTSCVMAQNSCFARMTGEQVSMVIASEKEKEMVAQSYVANASKTKDQKWSEKYPLKESAEAENLIEQKNSWKKILETTNKSKDDSIITR